ncbi:MAG: DUF6036 family nucleotidyltransferase [Thermoleophilaceae bacterium]
MTDFQPAAIFRALDESNVDYVTVGGMAVIAHGVVRATVDVDLIPNSNRENLQRLAAALAALGATPDGEPDTAVAAELLGRDANMRFQSPAGQIDVLLAEQYRRLYDDFRRRSVEVEVEGTPIVVVSRNDLIRLKAGTGRDRDLLDVGDLLALEE